MENNRNLRHLNFFSFFGYRIGSEFLKYQNAPKGVLVLKSWSLYSFR